MGDVSEAAKAKAQEIVGGWSAKGLLENVGSFVQAVSDACKDCEGLFAFAANMDILRPFILPEPVDIVTDLMRTVGAEFADNCLRAELAKRGLEIRPVQS